MTRDLFLTEEINNTFTVTPIGDLGDLHFEELSVGGDRLVTQYEAKSQLANVLVDFCNTSYFGSSTISVLLKLWQRVQARGGRMVFCCMTDDEVEILEVVQLIQLWPMCATRDDAFALLAEA